MTSSSNSTFTQLTLTSKTLPNIFLVSTDVLYDFGLGVLARVSYEKNN